MTLLLLPQSLMTNANSMKALCDTLQSHFHIAKRFENATVSRAEGTWTDSWRESEGIATDLPLALTHARALGASAQPGAKTIALATPLAATLGLTDLTVLDDAQTRLTDDDSCALCEAANAHLAQDGVSLRFVNANEWLLQSTQTIEALTEHPMFIAGENMRQFLPRGRDARLVERWMNELQMLLFTHPINATRQSSGLPPINVVWLHSFSQPDAPAVRVAQVIATEFSQAIKRGDVDAWRMAWGTLESELLSADEVVLGDAFPRLRLKFEPLKKAGLFSWFTKKPSLAEVLMRLQRSVYQ